MADHGPPTPPAASGIDAHRATYEGFLSGSVALALMCCFVLVALVAFRFTDYPFDFLAGFGGLIIGAIATLIGLRAGNKWGIPAVLLVLYALFTATQVHMS